MRHVSRTHRVAFDWLFDRIYLDPEIQIRYLDTKHQSADILTKRNFTRDEWNHLLYLSNISHLSSLAVQRISAWAAAPERWRREWMQEQKEGNKIVAKSKPTAMNLAVTVSTCSFVNSPIVSKSLGILEASSRQIGCLGKPDVRRKRNSKPDAASSSQGWQKDALLDVCTGKPVATDKYQETVCTRKPVAPGYQGYIQETQELQENSEDSETEGRNWPHHYHISPECVPNMNKVFSIVRQTYDRSPTDDLNDLDVYTAFWCILMSVTLHAAVHLGQDYTENLRSTKNQPLKSVRHLFQTTERLITDQRADHAWLEAANVERNNSVVWESCSDCEFQDLRIFQLSQSKPGKTGSNGFWKHASSKIWIESTGSRLSSSGKVPGIHHVGNSRRDSKDDDGIKVWTRAIQKKDHLRGKTKKQRELYCELGQNYRVCSKIPVRTWAIFWCLDTRRNGMEPILTNLTENGTGLLEADILYFVPPEFWKEENWEAREKERHLLTSTEVMKPLSSLFALLCLSVNSGSTEQSQICVNN